MINSEKIDLYTKAKGVARDNDQYLAKAIALNGNSWSTINLWAYPLEGEQAERRPFAEENFSYPVNAAPNVSRGEGAVDILPALPVFANAAKGAGYTNVVIDNDGVRRRVYLTQNVHDHWYLQLAFAPLMDYLGNPEIIYEKRRMIIKQAKVQDGKTKDIIIPLDPKGRMILDWPKTNYNDSYTPHISFAVFNELDDIEVEIIKYVHALSSAELDFFAEYDSLFSSVKINLLDMINLFDASYESKSYAMENTDNNAFSDYLEYRKHAYGIMREIINNDPITKIESICMYLVQERPEIAEALAEESEYIVLLLETLKAYLDLHNEISENNDKNLRGKFVIIGRTDTGTTDYGANPFFGKYINVGTHGVVLDTILSESFIISVDHWLKILIMLVFVSLIFMFSANLAPVIRTAFGFFTAVIFILLTILLFRFTGIFFGPIGISLAIVSAIIIREVISYANSEKEKHFISAAFSTYVSHDVVKEIIADPSRLQLGGAKRHMTAIFTDVKGFSTISEELGDPVKLVSLLNKYLSAMSDVVLAEKGVIDKFEGDAIIAFFGAPNDLPDHALRACVSAITMKKVETELNRIIMEENLSPHPLFTRIGINTGDMVAGNMGTASKMNYTIMGNAVNLAARLEGVNKQYGTWVLASENTVRETGDALFYRKLDRVRVVGINKPVRLCELLDMAETASEQDKKLVSVFHEALDKFEERKWQQAKEGFLEALSIKADDAPSTIYLDRIKQFMVSEPKENWDGVYNLTSK